MTRIVNQFTQHSNKASARPHAVRAQSCLTTTLGFCFVARFQGVVAREVENVGSRTDGKYRLCTGRLAVEGGWFHWYCNGGLVALAMHAAMDVKTALQPETFRWDGHCTRRRHRVLLLLRRPATQESVPRRTEPTKPVRLRPSRVLRERRFPRSWSGRHRSNGSATQVTPRVVERSTSGAPVGHDRGTTWLPCDRLRAVVSSAGDPGNRQTRTLFRPPKRNRDSTVV